MPFIVFIRHGWFLGEWWKHTLARNRAQLELIASLDVRFLSGQMPRLIYAGPEPETRETAHVLLDYYGSCSPRIRAEVRIESCLREVRTDPDTGTFAQEIVSGGRSAIFSTHHRSIERIANALAAAKQAALNWLPIPDRDQALVIDLDSMTATIHSRTK